MINLPTSLNDHRLIFHPRFSDAFFLVLFLIAGCATPVVTIGPPAWRLNVQNTSHRNITDGALASNSGKLHIYTPYGAMGTGQTLHFGAMPGATPVKLQAIWTWEGDTQVHSQEADVPQSAAGKTDFSGQLRVEISDSGARIEAVPDPLHIPS